MAPGNDRKGPKTPGKPSSEGKKKKRPSRGNTFAENEEHNSSYYDDSKAVFAKRANISPPLRSGGLSSSGLSSNGSSHSGFVSGEMPSGRPPSNRSTSSRQSSSNRPQANRPQSNRTSSSRPPSRRPTENRPQLQRDSSNRPPLGRNQSSYNTKKQRNHPAGNQAKPTNTKMQKMLIKVGAVVGFLIIATLVFYFGFVKPNDNYEAQMRIGLKHLDAMEFEDAELAFNKALGFQPKDPDATIGLSDTFIATERFEEAVPLLTEMQASYITDVRSYDRLITIYISHLPNIDKANEQIVGCVTNGLRPENELVSEGPSMNPNGGTFNERTSVSMTAPEGHVILYTTDGTMPTFESAIYEAPITLSSNQETTITAISKGLDGLISWPNAVLFTLKIEHSFNSQVVALVGSSAKDIMKAEGPLFYSSTESEGLFYTTESGSVKFIFPKSALGGGDPNMTPLPGSAKAKAVSMEASNYVWSMPETMTVEELTQGLKIKEFAVEESKGVYSLGFYKGSLYFSFTLTDKNTLASTNILTVYG